MTKNWEVVCLFLRLFVFVFPILDAIPLTHEHSRGEKSAMWIILNISSHCDMIKMEIASSLRTS